MEAALLRLAGAVRCGIRLKAEQGLKKESLSQYIGKNVEFFKNAYVRKEGCMIRSELSKNHSR